MADQSAQELMDVITDFLAHTADTDHIDGAGELMDAKKAAKELAGRLDEVPDDVMREGVRAILENFSRTVDEMNIDVEIVYRDTGA